MKVVFKTVQKRSNKLVWNKDQNGDQSSRGSVIFCTALTRVDGYGGLAGGLQLDILGGSGGAMSTKVRLQRGGSAGTKDGCLVRVEFVKDDLK